MYDANFRLLFQVRLHNMALKAAEKLTNGCISLLKLGKYISHNIHLFFEDNMDVIMPEILYQCCYDKR